MSWVRRLQAKRGTKPDRSTVRRDRAAAAALPGANMEALPDEILTLIFSKLKHGPTLLDRLPLVCKRWRRVARDPASWAGVELTLANQVADESRVLLHAPAAKSLTLDPWLTGYPLPGRLVISALRRTRVVVRTLSILETGRRRPEPGLPYAVAHFLLRQWDSLRELRLHVNHHPDWDAASTLVAVAEMHRLKKLDLLTGPGIIYDGELRGRLSRLRELTVRARCPRDPADPGLPRGLVGDLVRAAKELRVVDLDLPDGGDRDACAQLRGVEVLVLNAFKDDNGYLRPDGEKAVAAVREAFSLVQKMETTVLRTAVVLLCRGEHPMYPYELKHECRDVLEEFTPLLPHVAMDLKMDGPSCRECRLRPSECPGFNWFDSAQDSHDVASEDGPDAVGSGAEDDREDYLAAIEGVFDSEPERSCVSDPDDLCDSDCNCSLCPSQPESLSGASASESDDPEMYYANAL